MIKLTRIYDGVWHIKEYERTFDPENRRSTDSKTLYIKDDIKYIARHIFGKNPNEFHNWCSYSVKSTRTWHVDNTHIACLFMCILTNGMGTHIKTNGAALELKPWNLYMVRGDVRHRSPYEPNVWRILLRTSYWKTLKRLALLEKYNSKKVTMIEE